MKPIIYTPLAGSHISHACQEAISLAQKHNRQVRFRFNGTRLTVNKRLSPRHVLRQWNEMTDASRRRYQQSKAGIEAAANRKAEIERKQYAVTEAIKCLPGLMEINNIDCLMGWLRSFAREADHVGIDFNAAAGLKGGGLEWICLLFESKGYRENYGVGEAPDYFHTRDRMGRYIIGQAINCMRRGMPPHPITDSFCAKYFAIKVDAVEPDKSNVES